MLIVWLNVFRLIRAAVLFTTETAELGVSELAVAPQTNQLSLISPHDNVMYPNAFRFSPVNLYPAQACM